MLKHLLVRLCWTVVAACALASSAHAALGDPTIPAKLTISTYFRCQGDETTAALTPEAACQVFVDRFNASSQAHGTAQAWDCSYTVMTIVNWTSIRSITGLGVVYPYGDPRPGVLVDVTTDVPYVSPCYPGEHTVAHTGYWYDQGQQQNYTCDFDKPHSDLAGNQCVCKDGFAASADSSACIPLQESFASRQACACGDQFGNPLAPLTGAKIERVFIDGSLSGFPLQLTYDSSSTPPFATTVPRKRYPTQEATLGQSWSSSLMRKLVFGQVGADGSFSIAAVRGDGSVVSFISNGAAINASWPTRDRLVRSSQGYSYYDADRATVEAYSSTGQLAQMARSSGESLSFVYSDSATPTNIAPGPDYLIAAIDAFGRRLDFGYAAAGAGTKLVAVVGPSGVPITLSYDGAGNLTSLRWQDGSSKVFSYAASGFPNALTGITDELAVRYAAFSYDMAGRAVSSQHAGGLDAYSVTYGTPPEVSTSFTFIPAANSILEQFSWSPPTASISTPTGTVLGLQAAMLSGSPRVSGVSQPGGSGCAASTSASAYDANNNLSQSDDFDGNRTCYVSDPARNLAITKVEGLPSSVPCSSVTPANAALPAGSRRSSTRWHPDWPLEVQRAEAGRLTTRVYN